MKKLRKIQKSIKKYQILLNTDTQKAKQNCKEYLKDVISIEDFINYFIEDTGKELQKWCDMSVTNFFSESKNIILQMKRWIDKLIINHYLNKMSKELVVAEKCKNNLTPVKERFLQFKYLTN